MGLTAFAPISAGGVGGWDPYTWRSSGVVGRTISWGVSGTVHLDVTPSLAPSSRGTFYRWRRGIALPCWLFHGALSCPVQPCLEQP